MQFNYQTKGANRGHLTFSDMKQGDIFKLCYSPSETLFITIFDAPWGNYLAVNLATGEIIEMEGSALVKRLSSDVSINYTDADLEQWRDEAVF